MADKKVWAIRLGAVDDEFIARVKKAAKRNHMSVSAYVTAVLETRVGRMKKELE